MSRLISDDAVSAALHFLSTSSQECAAARGMRVRREFMRKRARARLIKDSNEKTATARESYAEDHEDYARACEDEVQAVERDEYLRAERNKAEIILETWRTEQANHRAGSNFR